MNRSDYGENAKNACGFDAAHLGLVLAGMGIGAGLMYILDPRSGRSRRALIADQATSAANSLSDAAQSKARDLRNRAKGVVAEVGSALGGGRDAGAGTEGERVDQGAASGTSAPGQAQPSSRTAA